MNSGRFQPGQSGNPAGRAPGSRNNKSKLAVEALLDGAGEELTTRIIELARQDNLTALRLCVERVAPPRRGRAVSFEAPVMKTAADAPQAMGAIINAVASGDLTTAEAAELAKLVDTYMRSLDNAGHEARLMEIEREIAAHKHRFAQDDRPTPDGAEKGGATEAAVVDAE